MRRYLRKGAAVIAVVTLAGALVAASGILPIRASSDHFALTAWVLDFGKRRSVATHALGVDVPSLAEPWLVLKGAGHYHDGCRPCHGAPDLRMPIIAAEMTPPPADLPARVALYDPDELFYIVKHGIKFTGMPAWPAQERDDEIAAVVAFLRELPRLDAAAYRRLVHGEAPTTPSALTRSCDRCHGATGLGRGNAAFPTLAAQKPEYLFRALRAYARSTRNSGIMEPIAAGLSARQWRALAEHYAALASDTRAADSVPAAATIARGRAIAEFGIPDQDVPSCRDCHGPGGHQRNAAYPLLAGQYADYLVLQLEQFAAGRRGGSEYAHLMQQVAPRLSRADMEAVAAYYAQAAGAP